MIRASSKLLSIRLRLSSCTGYVSLKSIATMMLIEKSITKKSMQITKKKMWRPWKHVSEVSM